MAIDAGLDPGYYRSDVIVNSFEIIEPLMEIPTPFNLPYGISLQEEGRQLIMSRRIFNELNKQHRTNIKIFTEISNQKDKLSDDDIDKLYKLTKISKTIRFRSSDCLQALVKKIVESEPVQLTLCGCLDQERRSYLQLASIKNTKETYKRLNQKLVVVSIGAGGCLWEAEFLLRLRLAGYNNINFVIIDPSDISKKASRCLQKIDPVCSEITYYDKIEEYAKSKLKANILFLVDIDEIIINDEGGKKSLNHHSFHFLQSEGMLTEEESIITFTDIKGGRIASGIYTEETDELKAEKLKTSDN